jgi:hypothetical protein
MVLEFNKLDETYPSVFFCFLAFRQGVDKGVDIQNLKDSHIWVSSKNLKPLAH